MNKLSRKDIEMLEMLATTTESDDKLAEYIHYHKKAVKAYKAFREAVVNGIEVEKVVKEKTPNKLRAEVITRARACFSDWLQEIYPMYIGYTSRADIRCVEVKLFDCNKLKSKGIGKCSPADVYNEHIGKAIALGRALGKDVSEFENAVQPTVAVGQIIEFKSICKTETAKAKGIRYSGEPYVNHWFHLYVPHYRIIDDTNAIYEEGIE